MIEIKFNDEEEFGHIIREHLHKYNRTKCRWIKENTQINPSKTEYYNFEVHYDGNLIGGAIGTIKFGWYFLEELWIDEKYRGKNIGTKLMEKIEKCAQENNALGVRLETWNFQAKEFYQKMGYEIYATFEDCPPGTIDYFFKKRIK